MTASPTTTEEVRGGRPDRPTLEPPAPVTGEESSRPRWPTVVAAGLAVVALVATVVAGVLAVRLAQADPNDPPDSLSTTRSDALAAARSHAQAILSYDHRTLDADFAKAEAALTGKFKKDYARTTSTVVRPSAEQYKVVVKAEVTAASVVRAGEDRVVALLFVDQTTTSTRLEGPKVDLNRVRMTLVEQDGKWLVSELDAL
jgi:Mce-associated membrane protein